jgi:transposase InsO family protein
MPQRSRAPRCPGLVAADARCVIAAVVRRATGRAVCLAFAEALHRFGIPDEVFTNNGKQFTSRFARVRCCSSGSAGRTASWPAPQSPGSTKACKANCSIK